MMHRPLSLIPASTLEGFFFGSGKAHVVTGVALIILAGIAFSLWRMDRRLGRIESDIDSKNAGS